MSYQSHSPAPIRIITDPGPPRQRYDDCAKTWDMIRSRMEKSGAEKRFIESARLMFAAGVYAASKDVLMNRADSQSLSEAADKIERFT